MRDLGYRYTWVATLLLCFWSLPSAEANPAPNRLPGGVRPLPTVSHAPRVGGDQLANATVILALPYFDSGSTSGSANDYDEICPYGGSTAPDVAYRYTPAGNHALDLDLCSSSYDTKVYVYQNAAGNLIACNDDAGCGYSGWQSKLCNVSLTAGNDYYIVIDGYDSSSGEYALLIAEGLCLPQVPCPGDGIPEGEPPCADGYLDQYNAGCDPGGGWTPVPADADGCTTMCGRSCTYEYAGLQYRDSDWYRATAAGNTVSLWLQAEFIAEVFLIYGLDCAELTYVTDSGGPFGGVSLSWSEFEVGQELWVMVRPSADSGVPDSRYNLELCGITDPVIGACCLPDGCHLRSHAECTQQAGTFLGDGTTCEPDPCQPTPTERTSWGAIKHRFR